MAELIRATFDQNAAGRYLQGIPARDLTEDMYRALSKAQRVMVRRSPLYSVRTDKEMQELERSQKAPEPKTKPDVPTAVTAEPTGAGDAPDQEGA